MADGSGGRRAPWALTQAAFDELLARLDPDRVRAGERYEALHRKLVKYFEWQGATSPEDCADEAINRVARRMSQGEVVENPASYCLGVARLLLREAMRSQDRLRPLDDTAPAAAPIDEEDDQQRRRGACLDECLAALPAENRELILEYYADERGAKIERRRLLAARLGIEPNALRIRAHRIRTRLELCVGACVNRGVAQ